MMSGLYLLALVSLLNVPAASAWFFGSAEPPAAMTSSDVPSSCYSPSGTDCGWYSTCLEKRVPCAGRNGDYAMAYATKYCNNYKKNYNKFTAQGKKWVDAVKKCLQVKLVPLVRQSPAPSCPTIKAKAFASHVPCYSNPGYGAPTFCALTIGDQWTIFTTIGSAFGSEFLETVKGGVQTYGNCLG